MKGFRLIVIGLLVALFAIFAFQNRYSVPERPDSQVGEIVVQKDIAYGKHPKQKLDLCKPKDLKGKAPGVIFLHGGGGDKENFSWFCKEYAQRGFVAIAVNFREAPPPVYPKALEDSKTALAWLKEREDVDGKRIGASGGSLGGYLSSMLGTQEFKNKVECVLNNFGPTDFTDENWLGYTKREKHFIDQFFAGVTYEKNPELYVEASAITYVSANDADFFFTRSTNDSLVPRSQMTRMIEKLKSVGIEADFYEYNGKGGVHANKLPPRQVQKLNQKKLSFMESCLKR